MTEIPDTTPEAVSETTGASTAPLRKRLLADSEIIRRRAEGMKLQPLAEQAGIRMQTLSVWLRRPEIAARLKQEEQLVKLERAHEKRQREHKQKEARAAKRKAARDAKAVEPEIIVWDKENGERYDAYVERAAANGQHGKVHLRRGPILWG